MISRDLFYGSPASMYAGFFAIIFVILFWNLYRRRRRIGKLVSLSSIERSGVFYVCQSALFVISWLAATLALMQPLGNGHYPEGHTNKKQEAELRRPSHEVIILIDTSASMDIPDMHNGQTRLQYAQQLADEFVSELDGEQVSLYAFTESLQQLSPRTLDYLFVRMMIDQMSSHWDGSSGTDYYDVFTELRKQLLLTPLNTLKTIVFFSDGGDTRIEGAGVEEKTKKTALLLEVIAKSLQSNIRLYTLGLGSLQGGKVPGITYKGKPVVVKLEEPLLKQMAVAGNGRYLQANQYTAMDAARKLAEEINLLSTGAQGQAIEHSIKAEENPLIYDHYFQMPLGIAIIALLLALYFPQTRQACALCFFLFFSPLGAEKMREVNVFDEAQQWPKARLLLEKEQEVLDKSWQTEVVIYDKATLSLREGRIDEAISLLSSIPLTEHSSPLLFSSVKTNLGIAYLEKARALQQLSPAPFETIIAIQKQAQRVFIEAGSREMPNGDSFFLQQAAAVELAATLELSAQYALTSSSLYEGSSLLLLSLSNSLIERQFIQPNAIEDKIGNEYREILQKSLLYWKPLWESQRQKWENKALEKPLYQEGLFHFLEAEKSYQYALQDFSDPSGEKKNREWLEGAMAALLESMRILNGLDTKQIHLQSLLTSYRRVLGQEILTQGSVTALQKEQERALHTMQDPQIAAAAKELVLASESLKQRQAQMARTYIEMAKERIRRTLASYRPKTVESILEEIIDTHVFVELLMRQKYGDGNESNAFTSYLQAAGTDALQAINLFLPFVFHHQTTLYRGAGKNRCQARPWEQVLPLFEKGKQLAKNAQELLGKNAIFLSLQQQGLALLAFQQALAWLRTPVSDFTSPCEGQSSQEKKNQENTEQQAETPRPESTREILRTLQEFYQNDQIPKKPMQDRKQGSRPW